MKRDEEHYKKLIDKHNKKICRIAEKCNKEMKEHNITGLTTEQLYNKVKIKQNAK